MMTMAALNTGKNGVFELSFLLDKFCEKLYISKRQWVGAIWIERIVDIELYINAML